MSIIENNNFLKQWMDFNYRRNMIKIMFIVSGALKLITYILLYK